MASWDIDLITPDALHKDPTLLLHKRGLDSHGKSIGYMYSVANPQFT